MTNKDLLEVVANIASITTAIVAVWFWCYYQFTLWRKRDKVEEHLAEEKKLGTDKGQRTIAHIMAEVGLTEADVLQAVFSSKKIIRRKDVDPVTRKTRGLWLEYKGTPK
jgi:hypothetical protein